MTQESWGKHITAGTRAQHIKAKGTRPKTTAKNVGLKQMGLHILGLKDLAVKDLSLMELGNNIWGQGPRTNSVFLPHGTASTTRFSFVPGSSFSIANINPSM